MNQEPGLNAPRVLIVVRGGVAEFATDPGVAVEVFDFDNYHQGDPGKVPSAFADLATRFDAPVEGR